MVFGADPGRIDLHPPWLALSPELPSPRNEPVPSLSKGPGDGFGGKSAGKTAETGCRSALVLDGKRASDVRAVVMEGSDMSLLGQPFLRRIDTVKISNDVMTPEQASGRRT